VQFILLNIIFAGIICVGGDGIVNEVSIPSALFLWHFAQQYW